MKHLLYFKENLKSSNHSIDEILKHYFHCALWVDDYDEELKDKTIYDFSDEAREQAKSEIEWFVDKCSDIFDNTLDENIGHDLWLTRNGHGAGFRDRGYEDDDEEILCYLCDVLGESHLEVGNDDKIYFFGNSDKYKSFDFEKYKKEMELKKSAKKYNI